MRVLVADAFEKSGLDGLEALGCEVLYEPKLEGASLGARLAETGAEALVVRSTKVGAAEMEAARADPQGPWASRPRLPWTARPWWPSRSRA